ncbi:MAG: hypothetical protein Q9173_003070 [Seirophora scorigena]
MSSTQTMLASPMSGSPFAPMAVIPAINSKEVENVQHAATLTKVYRERDATKTFAAILNNYVLTLACIAMSESATSASSLPQSIGRTIYLLAVVIIASRMRVLENLVHEASHNNLFQSATSHRHLQFLYAFPVFRIIEDYRRSHLVHHKHLGDRQKDPYIVRLFDLGLDKLPERPTWYILGLPMTGFLTYEYLRLVPNLLDLLLGPFHCCASSNKILEITEHLGLDLQRDFGSSPYQHWGPAPLVPEPSQRRVPCDPPSVQPSPVSSIAQSSRELDGSFRSICTEVNHLKGSNRDLSPDEDRKDTCQGHINLTTKENIVTSD